MDEPFSAVDPIVRASLQDELIRLQADLHKTVVLVTHDVEEAIRVGDLVAVFRPGGHLAQVDEPERLLGLPADDYVRDFVGFDRGIRRLSFFPAGRLDLAVDTVLTASTTVAEAIVTATRVGDPWVLVVGKDGAPLGWAAAADLQQRPAGASLGDLTLASVGHTFRPETDSLRAALDATILSRTERAVAVDEHGKVIGTTSYERLRDAIRAAEDAADRLAAADRPAGAGRSVAADRAAGTAPEPGDAPGQAGAAPAAAAGPSIPEQPAGRTA
jgi:osmoprotectant transport system ATP-binding protein